MSYIPNRHTPEKDGYDYNSLSEYEKGLLDGIDLVIMDDAFWADGEKSLLRIAVDDACEELSELEKCVFEKMMDKIIDHAERYINTQANEYYMAMCESEKREMAADRQYFR